MKITLVSRPATASLLAGLLCCLPTGNQQAQIFLGSTTATTGFAGEAAAVSGFAGGSAVAVADTGVIVSSGGEAEASAMETAVASGLAVGASHAAVVAGGSASAAEASVANVSFVGGGGFFFAATTIAAEFVSAQVNTVCATFGATVMAVSEVTGLTINGQAVAVTGAANQIVFLADGGYVIINEQAAGFAGTTVNALHVVDMFAGVNVVFASVTAGVTCTTVTTPPPPPPPCDFLTGGGWIVGTPSGAKANFGVAGGIKNGAFWGHLNYIDHGNGMHVKATAVTGYAVDPNDSTCRIIDYNVTIDGQPGTARVRACDKGEPGRNDIFQIQLSTGYFAGGDLGGSHPGGGNIQLHQCH
ncbi:MAG: hypothetical protein DME25_01070 [Verrucomicrobia bacterium]|nr:MAG: hypothetical protein DME25_01070 [Verrucomicrobiota bacterium]